MSSGEVVEGDVPLACSCRTVYIALRVWSVNTHSYTSSPGHICAAALNVFGACPDSSWSPVADTEVTNLRALWLLRLGYLGISAGVGWGHVPQHGGAGVLCSQDKHPLSLN